MGVMKGRTSIAAVMAATMVLGSVAFAANSADISPNATIVMGYPASKTKEHHTQFATKTTTSVDVVAGASVLLDAHPVKDEEGKTPDYPYGPKVKQNGEVVWQGPGNLSSALLPKDEAYDVARVTIHYTRTGFGTNAIAAADGTAIGANTIAFGKGATTLGMNARTGYMLPDSYANEKELKHGLHFEKSDHATAVGTNSTGFGTNSTAIGADASTGWIEVAPRGKGYSDMSVDPYKNKDEDLLLTDPKSKYRGVITGDKLKELVTKDTTVKMHAYDNATAVGTNAKVRANNSVALGVNSVAVEENTVSVGNNTLNRRLVNVKDGRWEADSHDGATTGQVYKEMGKTGALSAALAGLHPMANMTQGMEIAAALGTYNGKTAVALGGFYHKKSNMQISWGASTVFSGHLAANVGVTYHVGTSTAKVGTMSSIEEQVAMLSQKVNELARENQQLRQQVNALMAK